MPGARVAHFCLLQSSAGSRIVSCLRAGHLFPLSLPGRCASTTRSRKAGPGSLKKPNSGPVHGRAAVHGRTTGVSKGAVLLHRNIIRQCAAVRGVNQP